MTPWVARSEAASSSVNARSADADLDELPAHPQEMQRQRGIGARAQHQPQGAGRVEQQEGQSGKALSRADEMQVVEDEHDRVIELGQRVDEQRHEAAARLADRRGERVERGALGDGAGCVQ